MGIYDPGDASCLDISFFFASASMLAHRYASRDNSRGLVKNYERGIKKEAKRKARSRAEVGTFCVEGNASQAAITRHRAAERTRGRTGRVPPGLCPSLHWLHSASKQSYLPIYHPFRPFSKLSQQQHARARCCGNLDGAQACESEEKKTAPGSVEGLLPSSPGFKSMAGGWGGSSGVRWGRVG